MLAHSRAGNYRFLGADGRPFSDGVVADDGFDIARARFEHPVALGQGLEAAVRHVVAAGRQVHAITGIELRIPAPLTQVGFGSFNRDYVFRLRSLGLESDGLMPAARTNVAPTGSGVSTPSVYAFTYTIPAQRRPVAFVLSGVPEEEPGEPVAMLESIMGVLSGRLDELGASWDDATAIQLYGVDDVQDVLIRTVLPRIGRPSMHGIHWYPSLPPIEGLRLEIDVRSAGTESVLRT